MRCSNRGEWLGNISSTQARSKECSKVVGFSLLELFTLHNPPPFRLPPSSPPISLFHLAQKISQNTHTHTHTPSVRHGSSPERGSSVVPFSKSSLLAVLLMLAPPAAAEQKCRTSSFDMNLSLVLHTGSCDSPAPLWQKGATRSQNNEIIGTRNTKLLPWSTSCRTG